MKDEVGTVYLLCFRSGLQSRPGVYARHYLGWTRNGVKQRLAEHLKGTGSPLVRAAVSLGLTPTLVRTWEHQTREFERRLKRSKNLPRYCPVCQDYVVDKPLNCVAVPKQGGT